MVAHDAGASSIVGTQALPNDPAGERVFRGINMEDMIRFQGMVGLRNLCRGRKNQCNTEKIPTPSQVRDRGTAVRRGPVRSART